MINLTFTLFGAVIGLIIWILANRFMPNLQKEVYQNYLTIFSPVSGHANSVSSLSYPLITGRSWHYALCFACIFMGLSVAYNPLMALWIGLLLVVMSYIALLDWHYQLISTNACLGLFLLGLLGARWQLSPLTLEQSLESGLICALFFYLIYYGAKYCYQQEALGRGDYWLMLGIGSFMPYQKLALFLLFASVTAILFYLWRKPQNTSLPFAPFLCFASIVMYLI